MSEQQKKKVRDANNASLLHLAIVNHNIEAINILLVLKNLEEWGQNNDGNTPLHLACRFKEISNIFLDYHKKNAISIEYLNYANKMGRTLLHELVYYRCDRWIALLGNIDGIDSNAQCVFGYTPFMLSIKFDTLEIAEILHETSKSIDVNYINTSGITALHYAVTKGYHKFCEFIIKQGADVNYPEKNKYGKTPLMMATRESYVGIVNLLIEHGAHVNAQDQSGRTALHHAVECKQINKLVIKVLCKHGAKILTNRQKETPIDVCKRLHVEDSIICELTKQLFL